MSTASDKHVIMPIRLTAEIGAKAALSGEFFVEHEVANSDFCGCGECEECLDGDGECERFMERIVIPWDTIKSIYAKVVEYFGEPL